MPDNPIVLITRPEPQASRFAAALSDVLPQTTEIRVTPLTEVQFRDANIAEDDFDAVVFTSELGVLALDRVWKSKRGKAFAVGDRTDLVAREKGWQSTSASGHSKDLVDLLISVKSNGVLLWVNGTNAKAEFAQDLRAAGVKFRESTLYDVVPTGHTIDPISKDRPLILPVFSPRSARVVRDRLGERARTATVVAISPETARAFGDAGQMHVSASPDMPAMIRALKGLFPLSTS